MVKKQRSPVDWLEDIIAWGDRMAGYIDGVDERTFLSDLKTQDAVVRCLECIGEASRQIVAAGHSKDFGEIEFAEAYWTRNRLAHGYYDVNASRIWVTANGPARQLVEQVRGARDKLQRG
jgi:uncharacterized protein with HEPN domain